MNAPTKSSCQSAPPVRGATGGEASEVPGESVSIRAPRERGDGGMLHPLPPYGKLKLFREPPWPDIYRSAMGRVLDVKELKQKRLQRTRT